MSRWQTEFEQHAFQASWKTILQEAPALTVDDETVVTALEELARFKRAIEYLQAAIGSMDVELVPRSVWDSFSQQCQPVLDQIRAYKSSRNIAHLQAANQHVDNLLSYVRPYLILPEQAITVLVSAASSYRSQLEEYVRVFLEKSNSNVAEIKLRRDESQSLLGSLQASKAKIDALIVELIDGDQNKESTQQAIVGLKSAIERQAVEIEKLYKRLLVDEPESKSVASQVSAAKDEVVEAQTQVVKLLAATKDQLTALEAFHLKIFGATGDEGKK